MKSHFILNFTNGFLTSLITFIIIQLIPLPEFPWNIDKVVIFAIIAFIIGVVLFRNKPLTSLIATVIGGIFAGFLIFNYSVFIADFVVNTLFGGVLVGVIGTILRYVINIIASFI